jgi:peroxiredoxin
MNKVFLLVFITFSFFTKAQDTTTFIKNGSSVPTFNFEIEKGKNVSINDYKGKVVVINFFATWCGPCRAELPMLHEQIWNKYKANPAFALFVFGREEGWGNILPFKAKAKFTFPMLPDEDRKIFQLFASQSIPRTVVLDKKGIVIFQSIGYNEKDFKEMELVIAKAIE